MLNVERSNIGWIKSADSEISSYSIERKGGYYLAETSYGAGIVLPNKIQEWAGDEQYILNLDLEYFSDFYEAEEVLRQMVPEIPANQAVIINHIYPSVAKGDYTVVASKDYIVITKEISYLRVVLNQMKYSGARYDLVNKLNFYEAQELALRAVKHQAGDPLLVLPFDLPTETIVFIPEILEVIKNDQTQKAVETWKK